MRINRNCGIEAMRLFLEDLPKDGACMPWPFWKRPDGYGLVNFAGKRWRAHRLSFTIAKGPIPEGMDVLHKCDNPPCCRPDHLFVGTDIDNHRDRISKGRPCQGPRPDMRGERHMNAKLTEAEVVQVRIMRSKGCTQVELAKTFNTTQANISLIVKRKTWAWL